MSLQRSLQNGRHAWAGVHSTRLPQLGHLTVAATTGHEQQVSTNETSLSVWTGLESTSAHDRKRMEHR